MEIQSLEFINPKLKYLLRSNINRSLSGLFKAVYKDPRISFYGDYAVLAHILFLVSEMYSEHKWTREQMLRAIRYTSFPQEEGRKNAYIPKEWERFLKN